jgi:hypothetical protein
MAEGKKSETIDWDGIYRKAVLRLEKDEKLREDVNLLWKFYNEKDYVSFRAQLRITSDKRFDNALNDLIEAVKKDLSKSHPEIVGEFISNLPSGKNNFLSAIYVLHVAIKEGKWQPDEKTKGNLDEIASRF